MAKKGHAKPEPQRPTTSEASATETSSATATSIPSGDAAGESEHAGASANAPKGGTRRESGGLQIVTRLSSELAARLDRYTDRLRNERFGLRVGRADAVRILIHERLAELEAADSSPATFSHKGNTYRRTGKFGADRVTGNPSAEYETDDGSRVWRDTAGAVREE